jgi:hypothetical protein
MLHSILDDKNFIYSCLLIAASRTKEMDKNKDFFIKLCEACWERMDYHNEWLLAHILWENLQNIVLKSEDP